MRELRLLDLWLREVWLNIQIFYWKTRQNDIRCQKDIIKFLIRMRSK